MYRGTLIHVRKAETGILVSKTLENEEIGVYVSIIVLRKTLGNLRSVDHPSASYRWFDTS